jgi:xylulokinase
VRGAAAIAGVALGWFDKVEAAASVLCAGPAEAYEPCAEGMARCDRRATRLEKSRKHLLALYRN